MGRHRDSRGFFEKMVGSVPGQPASPSRWVGDPVRVHLNLLLNTREGAVPHLPDYGVPDMSSYYSDYPASMGHLRAVIEELIRKYEPRLHNPHVRLIDTDEGEFRVSFLITGEIEEDDEVTLVKYRTTISSNGQAALANAEV